MHVLVFQHVPFEDLGAMAPWLDERKAQVQVIRQYEPESGLLPALSAVDLIIVLGGPMSVHDTDHYPWLDDEKAYIQCISGRNANVPSGRSLKPSRLPVRAYFTGMAKPLICQPRRNFWHTAMPA